MEIVQIVSVALPLLMSLINAAEEQYSNVQKSGKVKKAAVTNQVTNISNVMTAISKGGQKNTWAIIGAVAPMLIDGLVSGINLATKIAGKDPVFDTATDGQEEPPKDEMEKPEPVVAPAVRN